MRSLLFLVTFIFLLSSYSKADSISNVRFYKTDANRIVIYYDLIGKAKNPISPEYMSESGVWTPIPADAMNGDIGGHAAHGVKRRIVWNTGADINVSDIRIVNSEYPDAIINLTGHERSLKAVRVSSPMKLDGFLDEAAWKDAPPVTNFIQRELLEGEAASEKTEIRILFDEDKLYIGIICFDSESGKIVHNAMSRDGALRNDDNISIVLDTYDDHRSGYFFSTNPNGARYDGTMSSGSWWVEDDWNGLWDAKSRITDEGWTAEMFIPFKTLRFTSEEIQSWGINFSRKIARKNEEALWCSWQRDFGIMNLSQAGSLTGLENIKRGS